MFDHLSKDSYQELYTKFLCGIAHGGLDNIIFQGEFNGATSGSMNMGNVYAPKYSTYVINQALSYCQGYIALADRLYPGFEDLLPGEVIGHRQVIVAQFKKQVLKTRTKEQEEYAKRFLGPVLGIDVTT